MSNRQQELDDLLSMFHDFDIASAKLNADTLVLAVKIPWDSIWIKDDYNYTIRLELMNCTYFSCDYYKSTEQTKISDKTYQRASEKITTTNPLDIDGLELSIQRKISAQPGTYELHCNGNEEIDFAKITISAADYCIFDQDGKEITLDTMKQWATEWWKEIQKTWDEKKEQ
jgi:hypothetical protein